MDTQQPPMDTQELPIDSLIYSTNKFTEHLHKLNTILGAGILAMKKKSVSSYSLHTSRERYIINKIN